MTERDRDEWERDVSYTHHIIESYTPALKQDLAREAIDKGEPELGRREV